MPMHRITLHVSNKGGPVGGLGANAHDNTTYISDGEGKANRCMVSYTE